MAVNTSKVTSADNNGNVEISPHGNGKVRLPQNAGFQSNILSTDTSGDVKTFRVNDLTSSPAPDFPAGTDQIICDRIADNQVRKITLDKIAQYVNSGGAAGPGITVKPGSPPTPASPGDLWYNSASEDARLYIYFTDAGSTSQWIDTSPSAPLGQSGTTEMNFPTGAAGATYQAPNGVLYSWNTTYTAWQAETGRVKITIGSNGATLKDGEYVVIPSSGTTVNLPTSPAPGNSLTIVVAGVFKDTIVGRSGSNIMGLAEDITLDKQYAAMVFTYVDATHGWRLN